MIYLAVPNLLFIKPHKTASTSVEIALSCASSDPRDIITPLIPGDELTRNAAGGKMAQNWAWLHGTELRYRKDFNRYHQTGRIPKRKTPGGKGKLYSKLSARYYNHITPQGIRLRGGNKLLQSAYLVSMVRHPYEQMVSWAWHQKKLRWQDKTLSEVIDLLLDRPSPNLPYLFDKRRPDFVIRYESLPEDLARLSDQVGLDLNAHLPRTKSDHRNDRAEAAEALTESQKQRIQEKEAPIFVRYGYAT